MRYLHIIQPHLDDPMSMDLLHARMIGEFLRLSGVRRVVEVGCCWGVSTAAVLDCLSWYGNLASYTAIDPEIKPTVQLMIDDARLHGVNVTVREETSLQPTALKECVDADTVVILDGDHSPEVVNEEWRICMENGVLAVILHDCGRDAGLPGPRDLWLSCQGRHDAIDCRIRPGMRTERGICILPCPKWEHACAAKRAFEVWR